MRRYAPSKAEIAASESTDAAELDGLSTSANKFVRSRVAQNAATGADTLARLARDPDDYVRSAVARHPHTPPETLAAMSQTRDASRYVRSALAANPRTPTAALTPSRRDDYFTRKSLAGNPSTDPEVLRTLAADTDTTVVEQVAKNPATPEDTVLALVSHRSLCVAEALARRNRNPDPTRWRTIMVRRSVGRRFEEVPKRIPVEEGGRFPVSLIEAMAASSHRVLRLVAASQPDAPSQVLEVLAADEDMWVRARVAENEGASPALVTRMAQNETEARLIPLLANRPGLPDEAVIAIAARRIGAAHAALPDTAVHMLLAHPQPSVRATAARIITTEDTERWEQMLADEAKDVRVAAAAACPASLRDQQASHACKHVRAMVADLTGTPAVLLALSSDSEVTVRRRVVKNKACPSEAMMALAADPDQRVRTHAAARFMDAMTRTSVAGIPGVPGFPGTSSTSTI